ncbi:conserved hypothetical protein, partial [Ixodes scapularis]
LFCWTSLPTASRALCNSSLFQSSCLCASLELLSSSSSWPHRTSMLSSFPFVAPSSSFNCEAICSASCNFSVEACNCSSSSLPSVASSSFSLCRTSPFRARSSDVFFSAWNSSPIFSSFSFSTFSWDLEASTHSLKSLFSRCRDSSSRSSASNLENAAS